MPPVIRFCYFCGHGRLNIENGEEFIKCVSCHAVYYMGKIVTRPDITQEEADTLFTKTELTDQQRYGSSGRGKNRRARKKK
jgi:hypothetical protein